MESAKHSKKNEVEINFQPVLHSGCFDFVAEQNGVNFLVNRWLGWLGRPHSTRGSKSHLCQVFRVLITFFRAVRTLGRVQWGFEFREIIRQKSGVSQKLFVRSFFPKEILRDLTTVLNVEQMVHGVIAHRKKVPLV